MTPLFVILVAVAWVCILALLVYRKDGVSMDVKLLSDIRHDDFDGRLESARKRNDEFVQIMRDADAKVPKERNFFGWRFFKGGQSPTDTLLSEARENLKNSFDLRGQENQSVFSMTAVFLGMVSAFIYLAKQLMYMDCIGFFVLFLSVALPALFCIVVSATFLLESFKLTYKIPDSADDGVRFLLQGKDADGRKIPDSESHDLASEIKYRLIAESAARSLVNSDSNKLKSHCWAASRKYMKVGGIFLLAMLITAGAFKISISPSGDMLKQIFGWC